MRIPRSVFFLTFLIVLSAAGVFAGTDDPQESKAQLIFSDLDASFVPFDIERLCNPGLPVNQDNSRLSTCRLPVPNQPKIPVVTAPIGTVSREEDNRFPIAQWHVAELDEPLVFTPVTTSCGVWDVSLSFDPRQPSSPLLLKPDPNDPERGHIASVLEMNVHLHLVNQTTGQASDNPLVLGLGVAGPWALEAAEEPSNDPLGRAALSVPGSGSGCYPIWTVCDPADPEACAPQQCFWCFRATGLQFSFSFLD